MSFGGHSVMHSTYFETPSGRAALSGVHPGMFRPPVSPSTSSSIYTDRNTPAFGPDSYADSPTVKRKRHAPSEVELSRQWGLGLDQPSRSTAEHFRAPEVRRRVSRTNSRYTLAGEIATPGAEVQKGFSESMEDSTYSDMDYRRDAGPRRSQDEDEDDDEFGLPLSRYTTAESQLDPEEPPKRCDGWGAFAFNTIGGVVGKVWEFCKGGAFRGFHAGGGQGFQISSPTPSAPRGEVWCNEHDVPTLPQGSVGGTPGSFPTSLGVHSLQHDEKTPDTTPRPAVKRRQTGPNQGEELRRNWVIVSEETNNTKPRAPPEPKPSLAVQPPHRQPVNGRRISRPVSRIQTTASTLSSHARRMSGRVSLAGTPTSSSREPSTRSPIRDEPTPSRLPVVRHRSPVRSPTRASFSHQQTFFSSRIPSPSPFSASHQGHHHSHHRRSSSTLSAASGSALLSSSTPATASSVSRMRKRESICGVSENSPRLDKEARKLAARRQQEERQTDIRINDFNARLQEMIRQGREALGTTIEVDLDDDMGVWEDD